MRPSLFRKPGALLAITLVTCGWAAEVPADKYTEWSSEKEIFVAMRDGVHLSTDVMLPTGASGALPTILVRTPYDKNIEVMAALKWLETYVKQGYAVVLQSERGRYFSEGYYKRYLQGASTDGYDTVEWILKQSWSNGKVGSIGCSASGETQLPMAASNPLGLAAMIAGAAGDAVGNVPGNETQGGHYRGGVPLIGVWAWWHNDYVSSERLLLPPNSTQEQRIRLRNGYLVQPKMFFETDTSGVFSASALAALMHLPSKDVLREVGGPLTPFDDDVTWTPDDARWNDVEQIRSGSKPRVPALHINTWHDDSVGETTRLFRYLQDSGAPNQYLIVGAGSHCSFVGVPSPESTLSDLKFGDLEIGDARYEGDDHGYAKLFLDWFGYWLNGEQNHITDMPKVQLYVMGKGWISGDRWPLEGTRFTKYYLDGNTGSNLDLETGLLSTRLPSHAAIDSYIYDPGTPVPSRGGICCGPAFALDQRPLELRKDVLVYSTPPLGKPVTIAGPIDVVLYVSSSAKDTDFMVKLIDVYPDGKAINLDDDAFRVRYREGFDKKVLMQPGNVYKITLSDMVTGIRFPKGHRIRLDISSSDFPNDDRNLNTGGNNYDETSWVVAKNSIHHGAQYPSHVVLPVLTE
jgi:uncharacterized protein